MGPNHRQKWYKMSYGVSKQNKKHHMRLEWVSRGQVIKLNIIQNKSKINFYNIIKKIQNDSTIMLSKLVVQKITKTFPPILFIS